MDTYYVRSCRFETKASSHKEKLQRALRCWALELPIFGPARKFKGKNLQAAVRQLLDYDSDFSNGRHFIQISFDGENWLYPSEIDFSKYE